MNLFKKINQFFFDFDQQKKKCLSAIHSNKNQKTKKILEEMVQKYLIQYERPLVQKQNNLQSKLQIKLEDFFNSVLVDAIKSDNYGLIQIFQEVGYDPTKAKIKCKGEELSCLDFAFLTGKVESVKVLYNLHCPKRAYNWQKTYQNLAIRLGYPRVNYSDVHRIARGLTMEQFQREEEHRKKLLNKSKTF